MPQPSDDVTAILQDQGADRREMGRLLRAERDPLDAKLLGERDPDTPALRRELSRGERRLQELEAEARAKGWAVDKEALIYLHILPPGHVHTRLDEGGRVYDAGCEGCTRYHRLNRDGRMIAPEITRGAVLALLAEALEKGD